MKDMYSKLLLISVAGATLLVPIILSLGIYSKNISLVAPIILGISYIEIHLNHRKEVI